MTDYHIVWFGSREHAVLWSLEVHGLKVGGEVGGSPREKLESSD